MAKKKLSKDELLLKKLGIIAKKYTDDQLDASKLHQYEKATPNEGYLNTIILSTAKSLAEVTAQNTVAEIDIPKEFLLKSKKLLIVEAGTGANEGKWMVVKEDGVAVAEPYEAPAQITSAGAYLDLIVNTMDDDETPRHTIVDLSMFIDIYTPGNGIDITNHEISVKLASVSGLEFDENGFIRIKIDATNANGLAITANGIKLALAQASTNGVGGSAGAMSAQDKENLDRVVAETNTDLLTNAEIGSWFGYSAQESETILGAVSDDSITEDE